MKKPDLVVLIAVWEFLTALAILFIITGIASAFFYAYPWVWWDAMMWDVPRFGGIAIFILGIALLVVLAYFVIALMGGIGLLRGREWGRIIAIIHAALSLFWMPIGTVIGVLVLVYLTKSDVREYFESRG